MNVAAVMVASTQQAELETETMFMLAWYMAMETMVAQTPVEAEMTLEVMLIAFEAMMVSAVASTQTTTLAYPIAVIGKSTNVGTPRNSAKQVHIQNGGAG